MMEARVGRNVFHRTVLHGEHHQWRRRAGIATERVEEVVVAGLEFVHAVAVNICRGQRAAVELSEIDSLPARAILAAGDDLRIRAAMRAARVEGDDDFRMWIARVEIGDL